jgi:DMSO/TMAO reductase YedYZ molybdopterin-dependent catalytic subunit
MAITDKEIPAQTQNYYTVTGHRWAVFGAGVFASATMTLLILILLWTGLLTRSISNLLADKLASLFPPEVIEATIQAIGSLGKQIMFIGILIGQILVGGLLALLIMWITPRIYDRAQLWRNVFIVTVTLWFLVILVGLPLVDAGFVGSSLGEQQIPLLISTFLLFQVYSIAFGYFFFYLVPLQTGKIFANAEEEEDERSLPSRRRFVVGMTAFFVAAIGAGVGIGLMRNNASLGFADNEITPVGTFYNVSKNAIDPKVSGSGWKLEINGLVDKILTFDVNSVQKLLLKEQAYTLTCISNEVGGEYIGNAVWKGTPLKAVLEQAGVRPNAKRVVFTAADGYTDSIDLSKALDPDTLMAWEMNGAPLTDKHGYPLRMLIPDIYGMKNAKWVTSITLVDDANYQGFWQKQGWENLAVIKTQSSIVYPSDNARLKKDEAVTVRGIAFAGARGIQKVEVSFDNGQTWQTAKTKEPLSPFSWVLWNLDWTPAANANTRPTIKVRATDKTGTLQERAETPPFPAGAGGWHTISVIVS